MTYWFDFFFTNRRFIYLFILKKTDPKLIEELVHLMFDKLQSHNKPMPNTCAVQDLNLKFQCESWDWMGKQVYRLHVTEGEENGSVQVDGRG